MHHALRIEHLHKHFANGKHALNDINLTVAVTCPVNFGPVEA